MVSRQSIYLKNEIGSFDFGGFMDAWCVCLHKMSP